MWFNLINVVCFNIDDVNKKIIKTNVLEMKKCVFYFIRVKLFIIIVKLNNNKYL